jgi:GTPase SAR1 family protein
VITRTLYFPERDRTEQHWPQIWKQAAKDLPEYADLSGQQFAAFVPPGSALTKVKVLDLSRNQQNIPEVVISADLFPNLEYLFAYNSNIQTLRLEGRFARLKEINLSNSKLKRVEGLSAESLPALTQLFLFWNPLENIPREIFDKERKNVWEDVKNYLTALSSNLEKFYNHEAKLIWIGNSRAGKTTLNLFLTKGIFKSDTASTHGIDVSRFDETWEIPKGLLEDKKFEHLDSIRLNIWDFGGQEYYHSTHRLFLTDSSLYLLVWTSHSDTQNEEKNYFPKEYWRKTVRHYTKSQKNPLLIEVQNQVKRGEKAVSDDINQIKIVWRVEKEPDPEETIDDFKSDCRKLRRAIIQKLSQIDDLGREFPKVYDNIRTKLRKEKKLYYSSFEGFIDFCKRTDNTQAKIIDDSQVETMTRLFDESGSLVCFRFRDKINAASLKEYVFTQPHWLTDTMYKILSQDGNKYSFDRQHVKTVTADTGLSDEVWIDMMKEFELIFTTKSDPDVFIVPQYLPTTAQIDKEPQYQYLRISYSSKKKTHRHLAFVLHYPEFLPKPVFLRFLARYGKYSNELYWRTGIIFLSGDTEVLAECFYEADSGLPRRIEVWFDKHNAENEKLKKELFEAFYGIDDTADLCVGTDLAKGVVNYRQLKTLYESCHGNPKQIISVSHPKTNQSESYKLSEFPFLFDVSKTVMPKKIFISYSSKERELRAIFEERLKVYLKSTKNTFEDSWSDIEILPGEDWNESIQNALESSDIGILLVSPQFLGAKYIKENELKIMLERRRTEGYLIIPVLLRDSNFSNNETLKAMQFFKTYQSEYDVEDLSKKHLLMPFDELAEVKKPEERLLNKYFLKLANQIDELVNRAIR